MNNSNSPISNVSVLVLVVFLFLVVSICVHFFSRTRLCNSKSLCCQQVLAQCQQMEPSETIFVSIPNYRDPETANTIYHLFAQAFCPHHIYIGLCSQVENPALYFHNQLIKSICTLAAVCHDNGSNSLFTENPELFFQSHIRNESVPFSHARGPVPARSLIEKRLYGGEKYILMIDSHMRFEKDWDKICMDMLHRCPSNKPILTMPPSNYDGSSSSINTLSEFFVRDTNARNNPPRSTRTTTLFVDGIDGRTSLPLLRSRFYQCTSATAIPLKTSFWTPSFSFTYAKAHDEVPYDPYLRNLFAGEEIAMSARLWTHGWDFFSPTQMVVLHRQDRSYRRTFWELKKSPFDAEKRVQCLLDIRPMTSVRKETVLKDFASYDLGTNRTLKEYEVFCDINFPEKTFGGFARASLTYPPTNEEILTKVGSFSLLQKSFGVQYPGGLVSR